MSLQVFLLSFIFSIFSKKISRHEKPSDPDDPLSQQNLRDRYYGSNDPVADKLLNRAKALPKLTPPDDPSITTLFLGNLSRDDKLVVTEADIRFEFF